MAGFDGVSGSVGRYFAKQPSKNSVRAGSDALAQLRTSANIDRLSSEGLGAVTSLGGYQQLDHAQRTYSARAEQRSTAAVTTKNPVKAAWRHYQAHKALRSAAQVESAKSAYRNEAMELVENRRKNLTGSYSPEYSGRHSQYGHSDSNTSEESAYSSGYREGEGPGYQAV